MRKNSKVAQALHRLLPSGESLGFSSLFNFLRRKESVEQVMRPDDNATRYTKAQLEILIQHPELAKVDTSPLDREIDLIRKGERPNNTQHVEAWVKENEKIYGKTMGVTPVGVFSLRDALSVMAGASLFPSCEASAAYGRIGKLAAFTTGEEPDWSSFAPVNKKCREQILKDNPHLSRVDCKFIMRECRRLRDKGASEEKVEARLEKWMKRQEERFGKHVSVSAPERQAACATREILAIVTGRNIPSAQPQPDGGNINIRAAAGFVTADAFSVKDIDVAAFCVAKLAQANPDYVESAGAKKLVAGGRLARMAARTKKLIGLRV